MSEGELGDGAAHDLGASLAAWMDRQYELSAAAMLRSISAVHLVKERPAFGQTIRAAKGSVLASPTLASYDPDPDYFFHWLRDSAIAIDAARALIEGESCDAGARTHIKDFVRFSLALGDLNGRALVENGGLEPAADPSFQQYLRPAEELRAAAGEAIAGETRFNPDGTLDITKWARPQHDGPALRAVVVLRCWRRGFFDDAQSGAAARRLIDADLAFTHHNWRAPSFDIWEEEIGHHYYTRAVQQAALADGAAWLRKMGDPARADDYIAASHEIAQQLDRHWDAAKGFYLSRTDVAEGDPQKELDIAVILAAIHAGRGAGPHSVDDPKVYATLSRLEALFAETYAINRSAPRERGPAMGRYAGDRYYSGGAYYFATLGAAEFYFRLAALTAVEAADLKQAPSADVATLIEQGDRFMAVVRAYTPASGALSEQFDRTTGSQTSSKNLAWSHAALITAVAARRAALRR
jgi:glucoamylase